MTEIGAAIMVARDARLERNDERATRLRLDAERMLSAWIEERTYPDSASWRSDCRIVLLDFGSVNACISAP